MQTHYAVIALLVCGCDCSDGTASSMDASVDGASIDGTTVSDGNADADSPADAGGPIEPGPPPEWDPSFEVDGTGWRDSTEPLCNPYAGEFYERGVDIWSDDRGVFVLETIVNDPFMRGPPYPDGSVLHFNDGSGWETWYDRPAEPGSGGAWLLNGIPGGTLWLWPGACPLRRVDAPGETSCVYSEEPAVFHAHMVTETTGWLALADGPAWLDSAGATSVGELTDGAGPIAIYGDEDGAVFVDSGGIYSVGRTTDMTLLAAPPTDDAFSALWAAASDELWTGTENGQLVGLSGTAWTTVDSTTGGPIIDLWSDGETVYFITPLHFGRWTEAAGSELLIELTEGTAAIRSIVGDADTGEVYLGFIDGAFDMYACGPGMIVWFDGERFRRF